MHKIPSSLLLIFLIASCTSVEKLTWTLSENPTPLNIIHLTDVHLRDKDQRYVELARDIIKIHPDAVVITGDTFSSTGSLELLKWFLDLLEPIPHKAAIWGNHEYWSGEDLTRVRNIFESKGWDFLVNQNVDWQFGSRFLRVFGSDDLLSGHWELGKTDPTSVDVFLIHEPVLFDRILEKYPTIQDKLFLAGHTHGGQITFFGIPFYLPRGSAGYVKGKYIKGKNTLLVSKGLGDTGPPLRLFSPYDYFLIQL